MEKISKDWLKNKEFLSVCGFGVMALILILIGIFACKAPVVPLVFALMIETVIAVCFHQVELWIHGVILAVEIVAGILIGRAALMILCVVIYIAATIALQFMNERK